MYASMHLMSSAFPTRTRFRLRGPMSGHELHRKTQTTLNKPEIHPFPPFRPFRPESFKSCSCLAITPLLADVGVEPDTRTQGI